MLEDHVGFRIRRTSSRAIRSGADAIVVAVTNVGGASTVSAERIAKNRRRCGRRSGPALPAALWSAGHYQRLAAAGLTATESWGRRLPEPIAEPPDTQLVPPVGLSCGVSPVPHCSTSRPGRSRGYACRHDPRGCRYGSSKARVKLNGRRCRVVGRRQRRRRASR